MDGKMFFERSLLWLGCFYKKKKNTIENKFSILMYFMNT